MEVVLDFSKMEFFDFNSIESTNSTTEYVAMCDDCYMCQDCYNR